MTDIGKALLWASAILGVAWFGKEQGLDTATASTLVGGLTAAAVASISTKSTCGVCSLPRLF